MGSSPTKPGGELGGGTSRARLRSCLYLSRKRADVRAFPKSANGLSRSANQCVSSARARTAGSCRCLSSTAAWRCRSVSIRATHIRSAVSIRPLRKDLRQSSTRCARPSPRCAARPWGGHPRSCRNSPATTLMRVEGTLGSTLTNVAEVEEEGGEGACGAR